MKHLSHEIAWRGDSITKALIQPVAVFGCGALGSNFADSAARMGFANLRVIDFDRVEEANLGTQIWTRSDIGRLKADALKAHLFRVVGVEAESFPVKFDVSTAKKMLRGVALAVDCFDNAESRLLLQTECDSRNIHRISAGLSGDGMGLVSHKWRASYGPAPDGDPCDVPMSRSLVLLTVAILLEECVNALFNKRGRQDWTVTLRDLKIKSL